MAQRFLVCLLLLSSGCSGFQSLTVPLTGTWDGTCLRSTITEPARDADGGTIDGGATETTTVAYRIADTFTDTTRTHVFKWHRVGQGCSDTPYIMDTYEAEYVLSPSGTDGGYQKLDLTMKRATRVIRSADTANSANRNQAFGYSDWVVDAPRDITDRGYSPGDTPFAVTGEKEFNILRHASTSLWYGVMTTDLDGTTAERRPVSAATADLDEYKKRL